MKNRFSSVLIIIFILMTASVRAANQQLQVNGKDSVSLPGKWLNEGEQTTLFIKDDLTCVLKYTDYKDGDEVGKLVEIKGKAKIKGPHITIDWGKGYWYGTQTEYEYRDTGKQLVLWMTGKNKKPHNLPKGGKFGFYKDEPYFPKLKLKDNGEGTVTDLRTGLMWIKDPESFPALKGTHDWDEAEKICQELNFADYTDWRLPTLAELRTIVDRGQKPAIVRPLVGVADNYWTSTEANDPGTIYYLEFQTGQEYFWGRFNKLLIRPVRQIGQAMAAERIVKCQIDSANDESRSVIVYKGKCLFSAEKSGSFSLSNPISKNKPLYGSMVMVSVYVETNGVADIRGLTKDGINSRWGEAKRSLKDKACWVGEDFKVCAW